MEGIELDLELGRHGEVLGQLDALVLAHPFKEHLVELQMLALTAAAARPTRSRRSRRPATDVEELGIEPGSAAALHEDILRHSPELAPRPRGGPPAGSRRRRTARSVATASSTPSARACGRGPAADAHRPGRCGQDAPRGRGRARRRARLRRRRVLRLARGRRAPDDVPMAIVERARDRAARRRVPGAGRGALPLDEAPAARRGQLEHVLAAAPFIGGLLSAARASRCWRRVASRSPCRPRSAGPCRRSRWHADAVALFCERARAHDPDFDLDDANAAAVAEICRRVDGLPLAIELAAALAALSPAEIAERLDAALRAGPGPRDAPARQQTLRATIDWSHELLTDDEQACFARFAVFAGGATVDAAEAVTGAAST